MRWQKEDNNKKKEEIYSIRSQRQFIAADECEDFTQSLEEAKASVQELESTFQTCSQEEQVLIQQAITEYGKSVTYLENLLKTASEEEIEYHQYAATAQAQLSVSISFSDSITELWEQTVATLLQNPQVKASLTQADYGDDGRIAAQEMYTSLYFVKGSFLVSVTAIGHPGLAEEVGRLIESALTMNIVLLNPVQSVYDSNIPLISGKKMGVFVAVDAQEKALNSEQYTLVLEVSKDQFQECIYSIKLNASSPVTFESIEDTESGVTTDDGGTWNKETAEPIVGRHDVVTFLTFFGVKRTPAKGTSVKGFRFLLDPVDLTYDGYYEFEASVQDEKGKKITRKKMKKEAVGSGILQVAIVPIRVGWWAHPRYWLESIAELKNDRNFTDTAWTDVSYIEFAESLNKEQQEKIKGVERRIKRGIQGGRGKILYMELAQRITHFAKGVFPLAEEALKITTFTEQPQNLQVGVDDSLETIFEKLNQWAKSSSYDRVIGIVPGTGPGQGGVKFYMNPAVGVALWYVERAVVVALQAWDSIASHELAHTYRAVDEYGQDITEGLSTWQKWVIGPVIYPFIWFQDQRQWVRHSAEVIQIYVTSFKRKFTLKGPINTCVGEPGGHQVYNGFWAAKGEFMGTPQTPKNSLMGHLDDAWITTELYEGIRKQVMGKWKPVKGHEEIKVKEWKKGE
jgi:hypothetical protein